MQQPGVVGLGCSGGLPPELSSLLAVNFYAKATISKFSSMD